eukprot:TRINITY_DN9180_c0_g1_i1.p1 TRINITY_DN9180_c0_g1~~TRINITY_DN9180_c0_g1_i1.p1  ORF type:complete len:314 (-),score=34.87 TRINITY_DN9180_c0_g1_i1:72-1013(-)
MFTKGVFPLPKEETRYMQCHYCKNTFSTAHECQDHSPSELKTHEDTHRVQCQYCSERFYREDLPTHVTTIHNLSCQFCREVFCTKPLLEEHVKSGHQFICEICKSVFSSSALLTTHTNSAHTVTCRHCSLILLPQQLPKHLKENHHTRVKKKTRATSPSDDLENEDNSFSAADQHEHVHTYVCFCRKTFKKEEAFHQHNTSVHYTEENLDPPVDSEGRWVSHEFLLQEGFPKKYKSFGAFECRACKKKWISAHAYLGYKQGCQRCEKMMKARFMWLNDNTSRKERSRKENEGPHDASRCEACKLGFCKRTNDL